MKRLEWKPVMLTAMICMAFVAPGSSHSAGTGRRLDAATEFSGQDQPMIQNARVKGSKMIISGENFAAGTVVYLNGKAQKTISDEGSPSTLMRIKKIFKTVGPGDVASLQAQNPDSMMSEPFEVFVGKTITLEDGGTTVRVAVDERVQVVLKKEGYEWSVTVSDLTVLKRLDEAATVSGAQGIYQALKPGTAKLTGVGDPLCAKLRPACGLPSIQIEVTIVVE